MTLSKELLDILVCPKCKGGVVLLESGAGLSCAHCALTYPVRDGIPVMLVDEAEQVKGER